MNEETEAIRKLRTGTIFFIIAPIITIVAMLILGFTASLSLVDFFLSVGTHSSSGVLSSVMPLLTGAFVSLAIIGIAIVLYLVALIKIRSGFKVLTYTGKNVGIGYAGTSLIFISLILYVLAIILVIVGVNSSLLLSTLIDIGGVLGIIGYILTNIGFYKVGSEYNEGVIKTGGILAAIFIIPILPFIGYIMIYVGLGNIEK